MSNTPPTEPVVGAAVGEPSIPPTGSHTLPPPGPSGDSDWTVTVTDRIESLVGTVRDRTTVPITKIARAIVFGLIIAVAGIAALVLAVIGILRLHVYLPFHPEGRRVWVTYVALGAIFMLAGAFSWRKRTVRSKE
jgi:hypothetical protein